MKSSTEFPKWVWLFVGLVLVGSLYSMSLRHRVESRNKAVAPALEFAVIADAAATSATELSAAMEKLKLQGLVAVVLPESTLGDWLSDGRARALWSGEKRSLMIRSELRAVAEEAFARRGLTVSLEGQEPGWQVYSLESGITLDALRGVSLGIDAGAAESVRDAGLMLIARHTPTMGMAEDQIRATLTRSKNLGATAYLPQGDAVLGSRSRIKATAEILKSLGMAYASPEFARMAGESQMTAADPTNVIRLHAIQAAEVDRMSPGEVVERFARAYAERNQRILLIRPFDAGGDSALDNLSLSLQKITKAVVKEGGQPKPPKVWEDPNVLSWVLYVVGIGVLGVAAAVWMLLGVGGTLQLAGLIGLLGVAGLSFARHDPTYLATLGAVAFPILGYFAWRRLGVRSVPLQVVIITGLSLAGGLCVAGLLNGPAFFVKADTFFAVKLAHFLPIVVIAVLALLERVDIRAVMKSPITWGALALVIGLGAAFVLMQARTGNDNPGAVSGVEMQFRSLLERFFTTRPRTKEFLIGHPALLIGLLAAAQASRYGPGQARERLSNIAALLFVVGMIGQTSIVNTLCHLHTPLQVGLLRIAIGLMIGILLGVAIWVGIKRWLPQERTS